MAVAGRPLWGRGGWARLNQAWLVSSVYSIALARGAHLICTPGRSASPSGAVANPDSRTGPTAWQFGQMGVPGVGPWGDSGTLVVTVAGHPAE